MNPLIGFALPHAEQAPLYHLEDIGLQIGENEEQPILGCQQGTVLGHRRQRAIRDVLSSRHTAICTWNMAFRGTRD